MKLLCQAAIYRRASYIASLRHLFILPCPRSALSSFCFLSWTGIKEPHMRSGHIISYSELALALMIASSKCSPTTRSQFCRNLEFHFFSVPFRSICLVEWQCSLHSTDYIVLKIAHQSHQKLEVRQSYGLPHRSLHSRYAFYVNQNPI